MSAAITLQAPARPWYAVILSDRAARYTARVLFVLIWAWAGASFDDVPSPLGTLRFLVDEAQAGEILPAIYVSLVRAVIGLTLVLVLGVAIGVAMARWWRVRYLLTDLILVGITLPAFIWSLLVVMWWGFSNIGPIVVCVVSATPQLVVNTYEGASATPRSLLAMSEAYRVPSDRRYRWLVIPSMTEYVVAGYRTAILAGWGAVLLTEWFGNDKGVGFRAHYWYDAGNFDGLMGWGVIMMVLILAFDRIVMERVVRHYRRWRVGGAGWSR
jgi:NitT/TauT family transport system permease protein